MTYDIYVPSLNIIMEYQGWLHYQHHPFFGNVVHQKGQDNEKRDACTYHNISYFEVPYWWQYDQESIMAILHQARPDVIPDSPISLDNPKNHIVSLSWKG